MAQEDLSHVSVDQLQHACERQLQAFKETSDPNNDTSRCLELLRRTLLDPNTEASGVLLSGICFQRIERWCQTIPALVRYQLKPDEIADLQQNVARRLINRFKKHDPPYHLTTFPEFLAYLQATTLSAIRSMRRKEPRRLIAMNDQGEQSSVLVMMSLEEYVEETGLEPGSPAADEQLERRHSFERLLAILPEGTIRQAFYRRFALSETPEQVALALGISKSECYRIIERAIRMLSTNLEVRNLLSGDAEDTLNSTQG